MTNTLLYYVLSVFGWLSLQQVDNYWKRSLFPCSLNWNKPAVVGWKGDWKFCQNGDFLMVERKAALHEDMKHSWNFLGRFFHLNGHLVGVMVSVIVPSNYSPMLTRNCQYLNCFFNLWVSQDSCGNCSFILTNTRCLCTWVGWLPCSWSNLAWLCASLGKHQRGKWTH